MRPDPGPPRLLPPRGPLKAAASSSTSVVSLLTGPLVAPLCNLSGASSQSADCPISSLIRATDNDTTTNAPTSQGGSTGMYNSATVQTPGGVTLTTPGGTNDPKSTVDACATCGFGDADNLPWSTASSSTSTTSSLAFTNGPGGLAGSLWQMGTGWIASSAVDHDATTGGSVTATAQLNAPAVKVFALTGAGAFDAAVRVGAFMTSATANVNPTAPSPIVTAQTTTVDLWDNSEGSHPGARRAIQHPRRVGADRRQPGDGEECHCGVGRRRPDSPGWRQTPWSGAGSQDVDGRLGLVCPGQPTTRTPRRCTR
ncbi:MAG: hypothetical protein QOJ19_2990 [Acidimicrobiia bacterium]|nr:hypothetical protein [Acidimicrobiia bacterium]